MIQNRTEQNRTEQNRTEQNRTEVWRELPDVMTNIYKHLGDDISRSLFERRLVLNFTGNVLGWRTYIDREMPEGIEIIHSLRTHELQDMVLFGAGAYGRAIHRRYNNLPWKCFVDNVKHGNELQGLPILSVQELKVKYPEAFILITPMRSYDEMRQQLIAEGFSDEQIVCWSEWNAELTRRQYFDLPGLTYGNEQVFVDAGGYDGETAKNYINWSKGMYKKIYCLDPGTVAYEKCKRNLAGIPNVKVIHTGISDFTGQMQMYDGPTTAAVALEFMVNKGTPAKLPVARIDDICPDATFIKMDIEGAELSALRGAAETIRRNKPQMAICIYHKREDIWELPGYILSLRDDYTFYVRHYTTHTGETVLYAI